MTADSKFALKAQYFDESGGHYTESNLYIDDIYQPSHLKNREDFKTKSWVWSPLPRVSETLFPVFWLYQNDTATAFLCQILLIWLLIERRNIWPSDMNLCIISGINIQFFALPAWDVHWHRCDPNDRQKCRRFRLEVTSVFLSVLPFFFVSLSLTREDYLQCSFGNKFCSLEGVKRYIKNCI